MKKFIVIYHAPIELLAKMGESSPEDMKEDMKEWMKWAAKCGDKLVDMGTPLMGGQKVLPDGASSNSSREVCGYSILQANDIEAAKSLLIGHPHLSWDGACEIEVHEAMPLPS